MGEWIAKALVVGFLAIVFLGLPGLLIHFHRGFRRKVNDSRRGLYSASIGVLLILYGFLVADAYCDFRWGNFGWVSDTSPRFSYGVAPRISDYWQEAWAIYLSCVVGFVILVQGCITLRRDNREYLEEPILLTRGRFFAGFIGLTFLTAGLGILFTKFYKDQVAFQERTTEISRDVDADLRQLTFLKQSRTEEHIEELENRMNQLVLEIGSRSTGQEIEYGDRISLSQIAKYWGTHSERSQSPYAPQRTPKLEVILKQADPRL